ncbi:hypothetical protein [Acutalibacter muris]|nr:hypothetical protein [Acutalibacter muris]
MAAYKGALPVYRDLSHPNLIRLIEAGDMAFALLGNYSRELEN